MLSNAAMSEPTLLRTERLPRARRPGPTVVRDFTEILERINRAGTTLRLVEQTLEVARVLEV
jgi:hypothetical protein